MDKGKARPSVGTEGTRVAGWGNSFSDARFHGGNTAMYHGNSPQSSMPSKRPGTLVSAVIAMVLALLATIATVGPARAADPAPTLTAGWGTGCTSISVTSSGWDPSYRVYVRWYADGATSTPGVDGEVMTPVNTTWTKGVPLTVRGFSFRIVDAAGTYVTPLQDAAASCVLVVVPPDRLSASAVACDTISMSSSLNPEVFVFRVSEPGRADVDVRLPARTTPPTPASYQVQHPGAVVTVSMVWPGAGPGGSDFYYGSTTVATSSCAISVVPTPPSQEAVCGANNDSILYSAPVGTTYAVSPWRDSTLTVTASANPGYVLDGTASWTFTDAATPCEAAPVIPVIPAIPQPPADTATPTPTPTPGEPTPTQPATPLPGTALPTPAGTVPAALAPATGTTPRLGATTPATASGAAASLPYTGSDAMLVAGTGAALILGGLLLLRARSRRSTT